MIERLNWESAMRRGLYGDDASYHAWIASPERNAMCAEANGKVAAAYAAAGIPGMAGGYAKIAASYAHRAYPELLPEN
jgi:hypothetical protein